MRIMMYSHDSYGLGHLRRTLALAEAFVEADPNTNVLLLTGSTVSSSYRMSKGIDILKLPSAVKVGGGKYEPSRLSITFEKLKGLRSNLILGAAEAFEPDVFLVDKAPLGMKSEAQETLRFLNDERPGTLTVLGLRDVMDDPEHVRDSWRSRKARVTCGCIPPFRSCGLSLTTPSSTSCAFGASVFRFRRCSPSLRFSSTFFTASISGSILLAAR